MRRLVKEKLIPGDLVKKVIVISTRMSSQFVSGNANNKIPAQQTATTAS